MCRQTILPPHAEILSNDVQTEFYPKQRILMQRIFSNEIFIAFTYRSYIVNKKHNLGLLVSFLHLETLSLILLLLSGEFFQESYYIIILYYIRRMRKPPFFSSISSLGMLEY